MAKPVLTSPLMIPDTMGLIQLAAGRRLDLVPQMGKLVLVDMIEHEAVRFFDKPFAPSIGFWSNGLDVAAPKGSVEFASTQHFRNFRVQESQNPNYKEGHVGENAIFEWAKTQANAKTPLIIISNERKVARRAALDFPASQVQVLKVEELMELAAKQGLVGDAGKEMSAIALAVHNANLRQKQKRPGSRP